MTRLLVLASIVLVGSCGPGPGEPDGGGALDGGIDTDAPDAMAPDAVATDAVATDAAACSGEGHFECAGTTRMCCGGVWRAFTDGPCWPPDGGAPDCADGPAPGCPCTEEGVVECRSFRTSVTCTGGVWTEMPGVACCFF